MRLLAVCVLLSTFVASVPTAAQNIVANPNGAQTITQPVGTSLSINRLENIRYADRFASIQAAISDVPASGGTVFVPCGTPFAADIEMQSNVQLILDACTFVTGPNNGGSLVGIHLGAHVTGASVRGAGADVTILKVASGGTQFGAVIQDEGKSNTVSDMTLDCNGNATSTLIWLGTTDAKAHNLRLVHDLVGATSRNYAFDIRGGSNFEVSNVETYGGSKGGLSLVTKDGIGDYGSIAGGNFQNLYLHSSVRNGLDINVNASGTATGNSINALNFSNLFLQGNGTANDGTDDEYGMALNAGLNPNDIGSMSNLMFANVWAYQNNGSGVRLKGSIWNSIITLNSAGNGVGAKGTVDLDAVALRVGAGSSHPSLNTIIATGNRGGATNFLSTNAYSANNVFFATTCDPVSLSTSNDSLFQQGCAGLNLNIYGNLLVHGGQKSAVVALPSGKEVALYAMESPENWFEDFGEGVLQHGVWRQRIDPTFLQTISSQAGYHVFLTPRGNCRGLYVSKRGEDWFEVRELQGGVSNIPFDYRIVGKRRGFEASRLDDVKKRGASQVPAEPK